MVQALRIADIMHGRLVDSTTESFVFEITGSSDQIDAFIHLMEPLGLPRSAGPAWWRWRAAARACDAARTCAARRSRRS